MSFCRRWVLISVNLIFGHVYSRCFHVERCREINTPEFSALFRERAFSTGYTTRPAYQRTTFTTRDKIRAEHHPLAGRRFVVGVDHTHYN